MAKGSGSTRRSAPPRRTELSIEKINAVRDYMYTTDDNGKYSDSDKASAIYAAREELARLYPNQSFITPTALNVTEDGHLQVSIGINGKKVADAPRSNGTILLSTRDALFHVNHNGYSWKTETLNNLREQMSYVMQRARTGKIDERMEELMRPYREGIRLSQEQTRFMDIERKYRERR